MSWHCSQELVEEFSQANIWVTGSCARWKKIRMQERSCFAGKKIKASQSSQSGTTLTPLTGTPGMALSMSFLLDSPVKDSPLRENKKVQPTLETNGLLQQGSSEKYNQAELFSKTSPESASTLESWPEILPIWGMIVNGELFPLEKPEPCTLENAGGAWPTPTSSDSGGGARPAKKGDKGWYNVNKDGTRWGAILRDAVPAHEEEKSKWPTPTVNTRPNEGNVRLLRKQVLEGKLSEEEATQMLNGKSPFSAQGAVTAWPTPRAANPGSRVNGKGGKILNEEVEIAEGLRIRGEKKWPTPCASDYKGGTSVPRKDTGKVRTDRLDHCLEPYAKGRLNPDWVEWLMGWPIGWTSLDFIKIDMKRWWNYSMITEPAKYWEEDPADIPVGEKYHTSRLTNKKEYRADRLKCCGNGQVPQQLLLAIKILS